MDLTLPFAGARVIAHVGTQIVDDTTRALTLREATYPPVHYIPIDDVDQSLLATSENHTYCPYKGEASYYTITLPDDTLATPPGSTPSHTTQSHRSPDTSRSTPTA